MRCGNSGLFRSQRFDQPLLLVMREPCCIGRRIRQHPENKQAEKNRRHAFADKKPLPSCNTRDAMKAQQQIRKRSAHNSGYGCCRHEASQRPRFELFWKPGREVQDDSGKETGFRGAEQETQRIKFRRRARKRHAGRDESPRHHQNADPPTRANAHQNEVARYLENGIAEEEETCACAVDRIAEVQLATNKKSSVPNVNAVEICKNIQDEQKGNEPARDTRQRPLSQLSIGCHRLFADPQQDTSMFRNLYCVAAVRGGHAFAGPQVAQFCICPEADVTQLESDRFRVRSAVEQSYSFFSAGQRLGPYFLRAFSPDAVALLAEFVLV